MMVKDIRYEALSIDAQFGVKHRGKIRYTEESVRAMLAELRMVSAALIKATNFIEENVVWTDHRERHKPVVEDIFSNLRQHVANVLTFHVEYAVVSHHDIMDTEYCRILRDDLAKLQMHEMKIWQATALLYTPQHTVTITPQHVRERQQRVAAPKPKPTAPFVPTRVVLPKREKEERPHKLTAKELKAQEIAQKIAKKHFKKLIGD